MVRIGQFNLRSPYRLGGSTVCDQGSAGARGGGRVESIKFRSLGLLKLFVVYRLSRRSSNVVNSTRTASIGMTAEIFISNNESENLISVRGGEGNAAYRFLRTRS